MGTYGLEDDSPESTEVICKISVSFYYGHKNIMQLQLVSESPSSALNG